MRRKFIAIAAAVAFVVASFVATPTQAHAASKTVTIEVGDWWCKLNGKYRGSVASNLIDVVPGRNPAAQWRSGRTTTRSVEYNPNGSAVRIAGEVHCKTWWGDPGYYATVVAGRLMDRNYTTYWVV